MRPGKASNIGWPRIVPKPAMTTRSMSCFCSTLDQLRGVAVAVEVGAEAACARRARSHAVAVGDLRGPARPVDDARPRPGRRRRGSRRGWFRFPRPAPRPARPRHATSPPPPRFRARPVRWRRPNRAAPGRTGRRGGIRRTHGGTGWRTRRRRPTSTQSTPSGTASSDTVNPPLDPTSTRRRASRRRCPNRCRPRRSPSSGAGRCAGDRRRRESLRPDGLAANTNHVPSIDVVPISASAAASSGRKWEASWPVQAGPSGEPVRAKQITVARSVPRSSTRPDGSSAAAITGAAARRALTSSLIRRTSPRRRTTHLAGDPHRVRFVERHARGHRTT